MLTLVQALSHPVLITAATGLLTFDLTSGIARPPARRPRTAESAPMMPSMRRSRSSSAYITATPATVVIGAMVIAAVTAITITSPMVGFVTCLTLSFLLAQRRRQHQRRAAAARAAALPILIDALVALIRSGLSPAQAWRELRSCSPRELADIVQDVIGALDRGNRFADALANVLDEWGPASRGLFDALVTAERYGLPLVPALDRLAADAAAERRRVAETRARQLPVRLSIPLVICTLPAFVLLGIVPVLIASLSSLSRP